MTNAIYNCVNSEIAPGLDVDMMVSVSVVKVTVRSMSYCCCHVRKNDEFISAYTGESNLCVVQNVVTKTFEHLSLAVEGKSTCKPNRLWWLWWSW